MVVKDVGRLETEKTLFLIFDILYLNLEIRLGRVGIHRSLGDRARNSPGDSSLRQGHQ